MKRSIEKLESIPDHVLTDAFLVDGLQMNQTAIVHGDSLSISIAAASIIAKVTRDRMMDEYDRIYPQYGFANNKGYGTQEHINAIKKYDYKEPIDLLYTLMWLEELIPKYQIDISKVPNINDENIVMFKQFINEWNVMREKRNKREITYEEYIEWKLTYEVKSYD